MALLQLGFIGLGSMGLGMASCLQRHLAREQLPGLVYFNRTISRGDPLEELGASPASSIRDLILRCDLVFISLSDDSAVTDVISEIVKAGSPAELRGKIIVDTTTVHPSTPVMTQDHLSKHGITFVAAPVFGASPVASQGKLLWVVSGPEAAFKTIESFVQGVMGRNIIYMGEDVSKSVGLKTIGNMISASMMEVVAEAHVFAEKLAIPSVKLESLLEQQYGPLALSMSQRLTTGAYFPARDSRPWSSLELALKDVGIGLDCAEKHEFRLPTGEIAMSNLTDAARYGKKEARQLDSSSMYGVLRQLAGLDFATNLVKSRDRSKSL